MFQLRFEVVHKSYWLDVADYPEMPLAMAREIAIASRRLIKAKDCTVESLRVALPKSDSAIALEQRIKARDFDAQQTSHVPTFDTAYRTWYKMQVASNR